MNTIPKQQQRQLYLHSKFTIQRMTKKNKMKCMASRNNHHTLMNWAAIRVRVRAAHQKMEKVKM